MIHHQFFESEANSTLLSLLQVKKALPLIWVTWEGILILLIAES